MKNENNVIFSFFEVDGFRLTESQKQICSDFLMGNISKDEYLSNILDDNMSLLFNNAQNA